MTKLSLLLVALVSVAVVCAEPLRQNLDGNNSRVQRHATCGTDVMMGLEGCCEMPIILPYSAFQNCTSGLMANAFNANMSISSAKGKWGGIRRRLRDFGKQFMRNFRNSSSNQRKEDLKKTGNGNPICMFECVFKNQSLMTSSGKVDIAAVEKKISLSVNQTWKPIILEAIQNCSQEIAKMNISSLPTPSPTIKLCNLEPMLLTSCVHRYMLLECPTFDTKSSTCMTNIKRLSECSSTPVMKGKPSGPKGNK